MLRWHRTASVDWNLFGALERKRSFPYLVDLSEWGDTRPVTAWSHRPVTPPSTAMAPEGPSHTAGRAWKRWKESPGLVQVVEGRAPGLFFNGLYPQWLLSGSYMFIKDCGGFCNGFVRRTAPVSPDFTVWGSRRFEGTPVCAGRSRACACARVLPATLTLCQTLRGFGCEAMRGVFKGRSQVDLNILGTSAKQPLEEGGRCLLKADRDTKSVWMGRHAP